MKASGRRSRAAWGVATLVIVAAFVGQASLLRFTQDDAFISLRYARNLVEGHGLVFNPGERVEGYSNFSWTLLLALFLKLGAEPLTTSRWLGVAFGAAAIFGAARLAASLEGRWGLTAVGAAALVAACPAYALWATSGLETALFTCFVTWGLERGFAPGLDERDRAAAPVLFCLASLTRPEGPLLFVLWFAWRVAHAPGLRVLVRDAVLYAAPLAVYGGWKLAYYGDLLPNTYYAKAGISPAFAGRGLTYAAQYFGAYGAWGIVPALALAAVIGAGRRNVETGLLVVWIGYAVYVVGIGGDVLYEHRFWLPTLPVGAVLVARGAARVARHLAPSRFLAETSCALALALLAGLSFARNADVVRERRESERGFVRRMTLIGTWMRDNVAPDLTLATTTIGAISYYSGLPVLDMLGLTDAEIAHHPRPIEGLTDSWRETKYNAESVIRRQPDIILFSTGVRPSSASEKALYLYEDFDDTYYHYFFRSEPSRPGTDAFLRIRDEPPPVRLDRVDADPEFVDRYAEGLKGLGHRGELESSVAAFRRSVELGGPSIRWATEFLGATLWDLGRKTEARPILEESLARDPYAVAALERLAQDALAEDRLDDARRFYERLRRIDRDHYVPWMGLAEVYRRQGDFAAAFEFARRGIRCWNASPQGLLIFGDLAMRLGHLSEAEWAFARGLRLDPDSVPLRRRHEFLRGAARPGPGNTAFPGPGD